MSNFNITTENHIIANNVLTLGTVNETLRSQLLSELTRQTTDERHQFTPNTTTLLTSTLTEIELLVNDAKNRDLSPDLVDTFTVNSVEFTTIPMDSQYESDTCQNSMEDMWTVIIFLTTDPEVHGIMLYDYVVPDSLDSYKPSSGSFIILPGQARYQHVFDNTTDPISYLSVRLKSSRDLTVVEPVDFSEIDSFIQTMLKDM